MRTIKQNIKVIILFVIFILLFIQYSKGINYTKTMIVVESNNEHTIVKDKIANKTIIINEINRTINDKCKITFNDNNTDWIEDDTILSIEWIN